ncbi:MAG: aldehyde dehydrogenase family protein [SAR324 cluster bacterium]|nr:aldehyde dehydrogenase family protein [SAR324 cluster bacterium]HBL55508.1 aldehyde dehydrogenase [Deltaproteobacteria bacterium]
MKITDIYETMEYSPAPESPDLALEWLKEQKSKFGLFINGKWCKAKSGKVFSTDNPASGKKLASISEAGKSDVDSAVSAAKRAFPKWKALSGHERARYLYALARQLQKHSRLFAVLETLDNGKTIRETRDIDTPLVIRHFYHHAGWAQVLESEFPEHTAIGPVGQIIPWNFPLLMLSWKVAPALAAGNTVVLKPAEYTSLTAILFAEICEQIALPPGVFNLVTGPGETGSLLVKHPDLKKIAFTGSTDVGRLIREATAHTDKKLTLELGGKSPFIVFEDADLDSAIEGVVDAIWFNQGQVCCAGSRLLVQESVAEKVIERLKKRMAKLRVGDPLDKSMDMGAIIAPIQKERIRNLVEQGKKEGAEVWQWQGTLPQKAGKSGKTVGGCYFPPTFLTNVSPASTVAQTEIFGPVLVSMTFRTPDEAVMLANNSAYGLAASVWSENINQALHVAPKLKCGVVWINCTNQFDASVGFGGYRESGYGREGGHEGMFEYLKKKESGNAKDEFRIPVPKIKASTNGTLSLDRTAKLYIGGKQTRPDSGYSLNVVNADGSLAGEIGHGNRKDIRNAVEAAHKASGWQSSTPHLRAQILYFLAENLETRAVEFQNRIMQLTGVSKKQAGFEVKTAVSRIFTYAALADKHEGLIHQPPMRGLALALNEPIGVMGLVCPDETPLLGMLSMLLPAIAMGNTVVLVPSRPFALVATDFYQVLETSDVPSGVLNIVTGDAEELGSVLAKHDDVEGLWVVGTAEECTKMKKFSAGNMKIIWTNNGKQLNWFDKKPSEGREWMRRAAQVKNVWIPYGE